MEATIIHFHGSYHLTVVLCYLVQDSSAKMGCGRNGEGPGPVLQ